MSDMRAIRPIVPAIVLAYAMGAALIGSYTTEAHVAVGIPIAAALVLVVLRRHTRLVRAPLAPSTTRADANRRVLILWAVLLGATVYWQLMVFTSGPRDTYPTVSSLINIAMDPYPVRVTVWVAWLVLGWYLVRSAPTRTGRRNQGGGQ
jgi:hypothetical protein